MGKKWTLGRRIGYTPIEIEMGDPARSHVLSYLRFYGRPALCSVIYFFTDLAASIMEGLPARIMADKSAMILVRHLCGGVADVPPSVTLCGTEDFDLSKSPDKSNTTPLCVPCPPSAALQALAGGSAGS